MQFKSFIILSPFKKSFAQRFCIRLSLDAEYSFSGVFNSPASHTTIKRLATAAFPKTFMRLSPTDFIFLTKIFAFTSFMVGLYFFLQDAFLKHV